MSMSMSSRYAVVWPQGEGMRLVAYLLWNAYDTPVVCTVAIAIAVATVSPSSRHVSLCSCLCCCCCQACTSHPCVDGCDVYGWPAKFGSRSPE